MSPELKKKLKLDHPLNMRELAEAFGYGYSSIRAMKPPMVNGKCFPSVFRKHWALLAGKPGKAKKPDAGKAAAPKQASAPGESTDRLRSIVDRLHAPIRPSDRLAA